MRRLTAWVVAVGLLAIAACSDDSTTATPNSDETTTSTALDRTEQIPAKVSVELTGDLAGKIEGHTATTQFVVFQSEDPQLADRRIFGVETLEPLKVGDVAFTAGFAVRPFTGPGTYTIGEGSVEDRAAAARSGAPAATSDPSSIRVLWWPKAANVQDAYEYLRRDKPCTVVVGEGGKAGEITCPRLTGEARDKFFSLTMKWELV